MNIQARVILNTRCNYHCNSCGTHIKPLEAHILVTATDLLEAFASQRVCMECVATCAITDEADETVVEVYNKWLKESPHVYLRGDSQYEAVRVGKRTDACAQSAYLYLTGPWAGQIVYTDPIKMEKQATTT